LRRQAETARVVGRCPCGCPNFVLAVDGTRAAAPVASGMPAEATGAAPDGSPCDVILRVRGGYLAEVEVVGYGAGTVPVPDPADLRVWVPGAD
jgi:hypothetical protein